MARSKARPDCPRRAAPVHTEYLGSFLYYEEFVQVATNECGTNDMWEVSICVVLSSFRVFSALCVAQGVSSGPDANTSRRGLPFSTFVDTSTNTGCQWRRGFWEMIFVLC